MEKIVGIGAVVVAAVGLAGVPSTAEACGGTFCDSSTPESMGDPMAMRVDQTGETIVFAFDETHVEAHVQINYDPNTPADRFAWIVPVMAQPEVMVGSQALFLNLNNATAPSYGYVDFFEACGGGGGGGFGDDGGWDGCDGGGDGAAGDEGGGGSDGGAEDGATDGGGTEVLAQQTVGAFDYVLLQSTGAAELMEWLELNGYYADPAATEILDEYIAEGAMFAAFRLTNGADVGEIHPITIRYEGSEPCVPIRLTRVAAQDDMDIRVFLLGDRRAFPSNYRHVELNPLKLDWIGLGENYKELVSLAVDAEGADGRAFVTEYFGPTDVVSRDGIEYPLVDESAYATIAYTELLPTMAAQGLFGGCDGAKGCEWVHPLAQGIVAAVLPVPDGVDPTEFYSCVECFEGLIGDKFDNEFLVTAIRERIGDPAQRAVRLLSENAAVTRLYTTLSAHEMTDDPFFHQSASDAEDLVDYTSEVNTRTNDCSGNARMDLRGGRFVQLGGQAGWPDIAPETMPWVELIEERPMADLAPIVLVDNSALIDELLADFNSGQPSVAPQTGFRDCHDDGDDGGDGWPGQDGGDDDTVGIPSGGCGCTTQAPERGAGWMLTLLSLALGLRTRRRRVGA